MTRLSQAKYLFKKRLYLTDPIIAAQAMDEKKSELPLQYREILCVVRTSCHITAFALGFWEPCPAQCLL